MGRSVSCPPDAVITEYLQVDINDSDEWDEFIDDLREVVKERYPSFWDVDKWIGREDRAILANDHSYIGVSYYCDIVCVWGVVRPYATNESLSKHWLESIVGNFNKHLTKRYKGNKLNRIGTFSNGEGVFEVASYSVPRGTSGE